MDNNKRHWLLRFFEWDLTAAIAGSVALALIIGFGFAASQPLVKFDFQGAAIDDIVSGGTPVMGSLDTYPEQGPGDVVYGWTGSNLQEYSDQNVSNKLERDSNSSSSGNSFKIAGLTSQRYTFRFTVGSSDVAFATRIIFSSQITTSLVSDVGEWKTKDVIYEVGEGQDSLVLNISSADGSTPWGIAGLAIYETDQPIIPPSFVMNVEPASISILAGSSANFLIGLTPEADYSYSVALNVSNLPGGMTAEFVPPTVGYLPGSSSLAVTVAEGVAPTVYSLTIRAAGVDDPESVVKTALVNLTVTVPREEEEGEEEEEEKEEDKSETVFEDEGAEMTPEERVAESIRNFKVIDEYIAAVEQEQLIVDDDLDEINQVVLEFAAFPVVDLPPVPQTGTEIALQALTALGIIDSVVSNAPPGQRPSKIPQNIWQKFIGAIFSPAGG